MPEPINLNNMIEELILAGLSLLVVSVILLIGYFLVRLIINQVVKRLLRRRAVDDVFINFIALILNLLLMFFVLLIALNAVGINTGFLIAGMAAVLIALVAAMQGWLQNVAGGLSMLVNAPFKLNDLVEIGGKKGRVEEINLLSTAVRTGDNLEIILPNKDVVATTITNFDAHNRRRIDLIVGIGYEDDIRKAVGVIQEVLSSEPRVLPEPEPLIAVTELADHSVKLDVRPWVKTSDHGDTRRALLEAIKNAFDANQVTMPFHQLQIHSGQPVPRPRAGQEE
jgi:small conductance mechanosensitive channel